MNRNIRPLPSPFTTPPRPQHRRPAHAPPTRSSANPPATRLPSGLSLGLSFGLRPGRRTATRLAPALLLGAAPLLLGGCGGGGGAGGFASAMAVEEAGNGFGVLLPHRVAQLDPQGNPTTTHVPILTVEDLLANVTPTNPVLPPTTWPLTATLPSGDPGNHFVSVRFRNPIDASSVLDASGTSGQGLGGSILVTTTDANGSPVPLAGRAFVGGWTTAAPGSDEPFEEWVAPSTGGLLETRVPAGLGFPGTESPLDSAADLVDPRTFVFVADTDGDLSTHETFPPGTQVRVRVTTGVRSQGGESVTQGALACSSVGPDAVAPEVEASGGGTSLAVVPGNGDQGVDPNTAVRVTFTEPIQPRTLGDLADGSAPGVSPAIQLRFGPSSSPALLPFAVVPASPLDLSTWDLIPAYPFPGGGPACSLYADVQVIVNSDQFEDLTGNANLAAPQTFFSVGAGNGIANAPVTPDAVYVGRGGGQVGISVVDLNGFGQSTGVPDWDPLCPHAEGNSNFPNNPNLVAIGPALIPPLKPGSCTFDGGSAGPYTLTRNSALDDRLVTAPTLLSISDMMLGHPLDAVFNNGSPNGCQAGGGNACASTNFKLATFQTGPGSSFTLSGFPNLMQFAPHPNPPPISYPPTCVAPEILGQEPTSFDTFLFNGASNILGPGLQPFGNPGACLPADGLDNPVLNVMPIWGGPSQQLGQTPSNCPQYVLRQQIGNFLYAVDRTAGELVVLNSNRFTVLDRIPLPDPTSLAMGPNLDLLAVTNQGADSVSFVNIDPGHPAFHQVVKTVEVGQGPTGIAWDPGNEDILVCNTAGGSVSVISAASLTVRKTLASLVPSPIDVAITPRQLGFGLQRGVYFAYVLNADGKVSIFESGPSGVNGWGFDDMIGQLPMTFANPKAIQPDVRNLASAVWVVHEGQLGTDGAPTGVPGGAITNVAIVGGQSGVIPLDLGLFGSPQFRNLQWGVVASVGGDQLTGIPTDVAFDDWTNNTINPNFSSSYSAGSPRQPNAKGIVLQTVGGGVTIGKQPIRMFVAVPVSSEGPGVIDVIDLDAGLTRLDTNPHQPGVQSIPAPGARVVMDYFRQ